MNIVDDDEDELPQHQSDSSSSSSDSGEDNIVKHGRLDSSDESDVPRQRLDSSSSDDDNDETNVRQRQRLDSSSSEDTNTTGRRKRLDSSSDSDNNDGNVKKKKMMFSGTTAGLKSKEEFKKEMEKAKKERALKNSQIQNNDTVYRDRYGNRINQSKAEEEAFEKKSKLDWKLGQADKEMIQKEQEKLTHVKGLNFSSYEGTDVKLEKELKDEIRMEDPMANFLEKKKGTKKKLNRYQYLGPAGPANRFNIGPGYRWDGVDRTNGFEEKLLKNIKN